MSDDEGLFAVQVLEVPEDFFRTQLTQEAFLVKDVKRLRKIVHDNHQALSPDIRTAIVNLLRTCVERFAWDLDLASLDEPRSDVPPASASVSHEVDGKAEEEEEAEQQFPDLSSLLESLKADASDDDAELPVIVNLQDFEDQPMD